MNILITYDFITTNKSLGKDLCRKLDFIANILNNVGVSTTLDDTNYKVFPIEVLYSLLNQEFNAKEFNIIDLTNINKLGLNLIKSYINGYDLLITYELSPQTKELFDKEKIPYIDLWMSPIRFHKDILFSFFSNQDYIQRKFEKYKISEGPLHSSVKEIKNQCQYFKKDNINLENNCALVIGQLFQDKAVMNDNKFLTLLDYKNKLEVMSLNYSKIYFIKHPYMDEKDFQIIINAFSHIDNFKYLENVNIYSLLSKKEVHSVIAISSSVLYEANYFNKKIHYLYKPVMDSSYINIYKDFFKTKFWIDLLDLKNSTLDIEYINHNNYLRYKFSAFYAYDNFLEDKKIFFNNTSYHNLIKLYKFIELLDKEKRYIIYGFGSIGKLIFPLLQENVIAIIDKNLSDNNIIKQDGIPVIEASSLKQNDNVIISAFKYNNAIKKSIEVYGCSIITIDI